MSSRAEELAVSLVSQEKTNWETGTAFITEKVAFNIRPLIRKLRKLYWGVFDSPTDPTTGRDKIFIPLIESMTEAVVKNIDLDTKDINFRAKKPESIGITAIVRNIVKNELDNIFFGEKLDLLERDMAIDGTAVWYTGEKEDYEGKKCLDIRRVDLLNFYIDPTAPSIQEADSVIERIVITLDEFKKLAEKNKWANVDDAQSVNNINRYDSEQLYSSTPNSEVKLVELYKRTGKAPLQVITGKDKDSEEYIDTEIICSGTNDTWVFHAAKKLPSSMKPYEEAWYTRVPGRWYGKGIAEKLMVLQEWLNTVVNIRINRAYVAQLGIFKIRRGAGITPQALSRLASNGAVMVNDINDIEQFQMQESSPSSYNDESVIKDWAQRVTSAYEVVTGESLPSSTTATAISVQGQNAQSQFSLVKEGIGMFLQRWLKRHAIPVIMKSVKRGDILRITGDPEELRVYDERIANQIIYSGLEQAINNGIPVDPQQVEMERQKLLSQLSALGKDRYVEISEKIDFTEYDVQVYITNEEMDKGVMVQNLVSVLQVLGSIPNAGIQISTVVRQILDTMGLDSIQLTQRMVNSPDMMQGASMAPSGPGKSNGPQLSQANTLANAPKM